jgi:hypothetical protein
MMKMMKVITAIILIFALGLLAGSLGTKIYMNDRIMQFAGGNLSVRTNMLIGRLTDELDLTDTQQTEIKVILESPLKDLTRLRKEFLPRIRGPLSLTLDKIREILDDEQRKKLDAILAKRIGPFPQLRPGRITPDRILPDQYIEDLLERLHLTEEQTKQIRPILVNSFQEKHAIRGKSMRLRLETRNTLKRDMENLKSSTQDKLHPLLSEQQMNEYIKLSVEHSIMNQPSN